MPTTTNGDVELYYETFGDASDPVLLLVNGLGSQCINFKVEFCELFAAEGFRVVRFDKRSHNPIRREAELDNACPPIPWLGNRSVSFAYP